MNKNQPSLMCSPKSIGIIMDGNRRWAREQNLPVFEGHRRGYEKLKKVASWCKTASVRNLIVYAFSTENWDRTKQEVSFLMDLFRELLFKDTNWLKKENIKIKFVGQIERLALDIQQGIQRLEEQTKNGAQALYVAISYGGRAEILHALKKITCEKTPEEIQAIDEKDFSRYLWTQGMPDPDLIIRTSGENRLSNFLPWQSVYSELFFCKTFWPAFAKEDFLVILEQYNNRQRRKGR